jgi:acetyl-CoA acetyltransferase
MRTVAIARVHALPPANYWNRSVGDLAIEAAAPIVADFEAQAVFAAGTGASLVPQHQADFAAIVADRLGLNSRISLTLDAADVSGAAALYTAWLHVRHGLSETALVVAAAKVSDVSEAERLALMDRTLDQEAEVGSGLSFASQAGLLAGYCCSARGKDASAFTDASAANYAAWAKHCDGTGVTGAELRRDLVAAPPLVRTDFAQLLDGACAVLLSVDDTKQPAVLDSVATAGDIVALWERPEPLAFRAVSDAAMSALKGKGMPGWLEIDAAASVVQVLSLDALPKPRGTFALNLTGGSQGRGRVIGASPLYQLADAISAKSPCNDLLAVSVAGLGSRAYAAHISRRAAA